MTWWQDRRKRLGAICAVVAVLVIVGLINIDGGDDERDGAGRTSTAAATAGATAVASAPSSPSTARTSSPASATPKRSSPAPENVLPDVVGAGLQKAWDKVRDAGYHFVDIHDASGRGRRQILFASWQVCDQEPGPGSVAKESTVELGVVRHDEKCPVNGVPTKGPEIVDGRMPDLVGRSVNIVREALRGDAHVKAEDLAGNRAVLVETHWLVCTQKPAPGQPVPGTVEVGVVKYGEVCP